MNFYQKRRRIKESARKRNKEFDLSTKYLELLWEKQKGICPLWNIKMLNSSNKTKSPFYATLDRIDSNKGYIKDNVRWVCKSANEAKGRMSDELFFKLISYALNKRKQK